MRNDYRRWFGAATTVLVLAAVTWLGMTGPAGAQAPLTIRLGLSANPGGLITITAEEYAKRVNDALRGRVEVKVFPSSQLGTDEQMIKGVRAGTLEMFVPSTIMSTVEAKYGVFEMPYLLKDWAHIRKAAANPEIKRALFEPLPAKGLRALAFWENGFRHITNNVRPIVKPEDLRGIKLRVPSGVWRVKMFKAYGANPTPLAYAEVYSALQSGVMDGQENPFVQIWSGRFHEVQKYLSLTGHVYSPAYPVAGEKWWQSLPADVRAALERIAVETQEVAWREGERLDKELLAKLAATLKVNEADKNAFTQASRPIYDDFSKEVPGGGELIKLFQSLM
ncbi:MAG TPA: TRAP transporter substrate-binding protein [Methylomirabilota bacterium]|jgi:tripartite ATP-independent transporter DctP family solute receptor|nr:TRAP transporter substrate-binding protein [Methylomirabilota bacterium]